MVKSGSFSRSSLQSVWPKTCAMLIMLSLVGSDVAGLSLPKTYVPSEVVAKALEVYGHLTSKLFEYEGKVEMSDPASRKSARNLAMYVAKESRVHILNVNKMMSELEKAKKTLGDKWWKPLWATRLHFLRNFREPKYHSGFNADYKTNIIGCLSRCIQQVEVEQGRRAEAIMVSPYVSDFWCSCETEDQYRKLDELYSDRAIPFYFLRIPVLRYSKESTKRMMMIIEVQDGTDLNDKPIMKELIFDTLLFTLDNSYISRYAIPGALAKRIACRDVFFVPNPEKGDEDVWNFVMQEHGKLTQRCKKYLMEMSNRETPLELEILGDETSEVKEFRLREVSTVLELEDQDDTQNTNTVN